MGGGQSAEGSVGPGGVVVPRVFGHDPAQMVLVNDQQPVRQFPGNSRRRVPMTLSQMAFAGALAVGF